MARALHLDVDGPEDAAALAERLRLYGLEAASLRPLVGAAEIRVTKPLLQPTSRFRADVESIVRRWLEEEAPSLRSVALRSRRDYVEILNPTVDMFAAARPDSARR
jgi:hypothetical protein